MIYFDQDKLNVQAAYETFKGQNCNELSFYVLYIVQKCWTKLITLQVRAGLLPCCNMIPWTCVNVIQTLDGWCSSACNNLPKYA